MGDEDSRKIFVGGTRDADEKTVEDYFQQFGAIESCKVVVVVVVVVVVIGVRWEVGGMQSLSSYIDL